LNKATTSNQLKKLFKMKLNFKILAIASTFLVGAVAFSQQQIDNANFENWENVGSNNEEPNDWNSFYTASGGLSGQAIKTVWRESAPANVHSGSYAAKIVTGSTFGISVNGNLTCGRVNMGSTSATDPSNHNHTVTSDGAFNHVLTERPDSIVFWAKYAPNSGDNGSVAAILHDNFDYKFPESGTSPDHAIAYAQQTFGSTSGNYVRFSVAFDYASGASSSPAAYILINLTSSAAPGGGASGSTLYIDDLELIYNPRITTSSVSPLSYSVTNTLSDNIDVPFTVSYGPMDPGNVFTAQLSDATGNFNLPTNIGTLNSTTDGTISATIPAGTPSGSGYRVRVISSTPQATGTDNGQNIVIDLIGNSIAPTSSQSLLIGVDGTILTVTENPSGSSREWKYSTTSGSGYTAFTAAETGMTYTPNFASPGTYYIICESVISGDNIVSNEVTINVGAATITTLPTSPSLFEFSPSSPNGTLSVDYTTSGAFTPGNVFNVELSDENGSFVSSTIVGSVTSTTAGTISATIPNSTLSGTGYRLRVVGTNPSIFGSDNGSDINIIQFANPLSSTTTQDLAIDELGTSLVVYENQNTLSRKWQYSTTSGSGYVDFSPTQTNSSYTPQFAVNGTYYVLCKSTNFYGDEVASEEVIINVANGTVISTSTVFGTPINLSPSAVATIPVNFTSNVLFDPTNVFSVELSDATGDFTSATIIGTLVSNNVEAINVSIPNGTPAGTSYKMRVVSSNPAITGTECDNDIIIDQFNNAISGDATQTIVKNTYGAEMMVNESQISSREWKYTTTSGSGYLAFPTVETNTNYFPFFTEAGMYYVICESTNQQWSDMVQSNELIVIVDNTADINEESSEQVVIYSFDSQIKVTSSSNESIDIKLFSSNGQLVYQNKLTDSETILSPNLEFGIYLFQLQIGDKIHTGKIKL
jgi:hypothetical protein